MNNRATRPVVDAAQPALDLALERMREGTFQAIDQGYYDLELSLWEIRSEVGAARFRAALSELRTHPLFALLQSDPFIRHSYSRPRGYPGDAELLDFIYGEGRSAEKVSAASAWGQVSYQSMRNCIACRAVRYRADRIGEIVQRGIREVDGFRVFSLAAGHLCELRGVRWHRLPGLVVAGDQDPRSVAEIGRRYRPEHVEPRVVSVKDAIEGRLEDRGFHFAYAAGLYDYLPEKVASILSRRMLDMLAPGGSLLLANFVPECTGAAFMEFAMDWQLEYRDESDLERIIAQSTRPGEVEVELSRDPSGQIAFASLTRC